MFVSNWFAYRIERSLGIAGAQPIPYTPLKLHLTVVHKNWKDLGMSKEEVNLKLILVSGRTHEFSFQPNISASEVCQFVFENWPAEWKDEKVANASLLKLIYHGKVSKCFHFELFQILGRFLHGSVTLNALSLPHGKTTVMHLVTREHLPEPGSNGIVWKVKISINSLLF